MIGTVRAGNIGMMGTVELPQQILAISITHKDFIAKDY